MGHSRHQSPRSLGPVAGIASSGRTRFPKYSFRILTQSDFPDLTGRLWTGDFRCWTRPDLSIPATGQKDRVLWGREWSRAYPEPRIVHILTVNVTDRPVHALRGIMGNQGNFTKKQSRKTNVFLYISVLISHLATKHIQQAGKPLFLVYQRFWVHWAGH